MRPEPVPILTRRRGLLAAACLGMLLSPAVAQIGDPLGGGGSGPDPFRSTVTAAPTQILSGSGTSLITVQPRDSQGNSLGAGLAVILQTSAGSLLGSVQDLGDGRYTQTLQAAPGAGLALVSAFVSNQSIFIGATVQFVPLSLTRSEVAVDPGQVDIGGQATVTVSPRDDSGALLGAGLPVAIQTSMGSLLGSIVDLGDGRYSQSIQMDAAGSAVITATVLGQQLQDGASLEARQAVLGKVVGIAKDGSQLLYESIQQAVNRSRAHRLTKIMVAPGHFEERVLIRCRRNLIIEAMPQLGPTSVRGFVILGSKNIQIRGFAIDCRKRRCHGVWILRSRKILLSQILVLGTDDSIGRKGVKIGPWSRKVELDGVLLESRFRRWLRRRCR